MTEHGKLAYASSLAKLSDAERSENGKLGYAAGLAKLSDAERSENGRNNGKIGGDKTVELRLGVIGERMDKWDAYFPTLEAFVETVSYTN